MGVCVGWAAADPPLANKYHHPRAHEHAQERARTAAAHQAPEGQALLPDDCDESIIVTMIKMMMMVVVVVVMFVMMMTRRLQ